MEYLGMPQKKLRAGGYPRVSDPSLKDSPTLESQEKSIRAFIEEHSEYELSEEHIRPEAMSAYMKPYKERPEMMRLIDAARRHEYDVLVVTEYSRLSRHQTEQAVIIYILEQYGVQVVSVTEKFDDTPVGRFMRSVYAFVSELEREKIFIRTSRGRRDRAENGNLTGQGKPAYGYRYVDTEEETKARYELNTQVIYVDEQGREWTEAKVILFMVDSILEGMSTRQLAFTLTRIGIPTRYGKPYWKNTTIQQILTNPVIMGKATAFHYYRNGNKSGRRPAEERIQLPNVAPAIIDEATFEVIQEQLVRNKQNSTRNNKQPLENLGLLRGGLARCGICGRTLIFKHRTGFKGKYTKDDYFCRINTGIDNVLNHHNVVISMKVLDEQAWQFAIPYIKNPTLVRERVNEIRQTQRDNNHTEEITGKLSEVKRQLSNLYKLAKSASDSDVLDDLAGMLKNLEKQKRELEYMLYVAEEKDEEAKQIEHELNKFEAWANQVRPLLDDPTYQPSYNEKRLACQILGVKASVYPSVGYPERIKIEVSPPKLASLISTYR
jgi:site-specific DNA recombinase